MAKYYYHGAGIQQQKRKIRIIGFFLVAVGILFLGYFFLPVISYQVFLSRAFAQDLETPIPKRMVAKEGDGVVGLIAQGIHSLTTDYSDARNWYPSIKQSQSHSNNSVDSYTLTIPKLKIENAAVSRVDYDLSKQLVHYYGPTNPLDKGTSVIYGHSTLPQWFDPKDYTKIFATMHTLSVGDEIVLNVQGQQYTYKVFAMTITTPDDVDIFSQTYDNSYLAIVTCTPPGTTWKRLIVRAALEQS